MGHEVLKFIFLLRSQKKLRTKRVYNILSPSKKLKIDSKGNELNTKTKYCDIVFLDHSLLWRFEVITPLGMIKKCQVEINQMRERNKERGRMRRRRGIMGARSKERGIFDQITALNNAFYLFDYKIFAISYQVQRYGYTPWDYKMNITQNSDSWLCSEEPNPLGFGYEYWTFSTKQEHNKNMFLLAVNKCLLN